MDKTLSKNIFAKSNFGNSGVIKHIIRCPVCNFEYNHIGTPIVEKGNDNYESSSGLRGDMLIIPFRCEENHEWSICFPHHKGYTFIFMRTE